MSLQLIICGFHRSGTSMSAQALQRAGLYLGESLIHANPSNPDGHFEDIETVNLHDKWLAKNNTDWCHFGELPFVDSAQVELDLAPVIARFDKSNTHWGIKDPRASLFLSHWYCALQNPATIMAYRHYASCVDSLRRRQAGDLLLDPSIDNQSVRFWQDPEVALRSWLLHNKALLTHHEQYPETCLLLSQEAQVHGVSLAYLANQKFDLSLNTESATGIDIKKTRIQQSILLPIVDEQLQSELESTWQKLQLAAASPALHHPQVEWQSDKEIAKAVLEGELVSQWDRLNIPKPANTHAFVNGVSDSLPITNFRSIDAHEKEVTPESVALEIDATNLYQRPNIHHVLRQLSQVDQTKFLEHVLDKFPQDTFINGLLGRLYLAQQELEKAEVCLNLASQENDHSTWFHIGLLRVQQERFEGAIEAFEYGFEIHANPDHGVTLIRTCIDSGNYKKAIYNCEKAMRVFPQDHRFTALNADVLCLQDQWEDALNLCLNQDFKSTDTALLFKGFQILTELGRSKEADLLYNKAIIRSLRNQSNYRERAANVLDLLSGAQASALQKQWVLRLSGFVDEQYPEPITSTNRTNLC